MKILVEKSFNYSASMEGFDVMGSVLIEVNAPESVVETFKKGEIHDNDEFKAFLKENRIGYFQFAGCLIDGQWYKTIMPHQCFLEGLEKVEGRNYPQMTQESLKEWKYLTGEDVGPYGGAFASEQEYLAYRGIKPDKY